MSQGANADERYRHQSADERRNAEYVASKMGGLTEPPEIEWKEDYAWCHDQDIPFTQVFKHAALKRDNRIVTIPRIWPPISLADMETGPEALVSTPRHLKLSQVVREEWMECVRIPTRTVYDEDRNVLVIWYRQETHLFPIWIGDDVDGG